MFTFFFPFTEWMNGGGANDHDTMLLDLLAIRAAAVGEAGTENKTNTEYLG